MLSKSRIYLLFLLLFLSKQTYALPDSSYNVDQVNSIYGLTGSDLYQITLDVTLSNTNNFTTANRLYTMRDWRFRFTEQNLFIRNATNSFNNIDFQNSHYGILGILAIETVSNNNAPPYNNRVLFVEVDEESALWIGASVPFTIKNGNPVSCINEAYINNGLSGYMVSIPNVSTISPECSGSNGSIAKVDGGIIFMNKNGYQYRYGSSSVTIPLNDRLHYISHEITHLFGLSHTSPVNSSSSPEFCNSIMIPSLFTSNKNEPPNLRICGGAVPTQLDCADRLAVYALLCQPNSSGCQITFPYTCQ